MTTLGTIMPAPWFTGLDSDGTPLNGGLLYVYLAGTLDPVDTWSDADLDPMNLNAWPVVLDSAGRATVFLDDISYKFVLKRSNGTLVRTADNIGSTSLGQSESTEIFIFGGNSSIVITDVAYPVGATVDKLHNGTAVFEVDTDTLPGTYQLQGMLLADGGTVTAALVNLSDGFPDIPIVTITSVSATGELVNSLDIVLPAGGSSKQFGIKVKVSAGAGYAWGIKMVKV
jgi:hypothetical protein